MPSKARRYSHAESLTLSTTTTASDQTKVTLTFTPDASSTYVYIWNADIQATTGTTYDNIVTLKNNAGTALSATNWEARDTTDFATISGLAFETFGASPTSQSITLTYRTESAGNSVGIRNARIVAIKLTAADAYVENTADASTTSTSLQTATTLTFTPATTGTYLILGSAETRSSGASVTVNSQITYNSVGYNVAAARPNDTSNYVSGLMQASVGSLTATSKSITLQYSSSLAQTVNCRRARLLALRLDEFSTSSITTDTASTSTTSLTYATKTTTGAVSITENLDYLVIGTAAIGPTTGSPTTISSGYGLSVASTYSSESLVESSQSTGHYASANFGSFKVITGGSAGGSAIITQFNYYSETASVTTVADDVTLSVLLLDPTDLYWVGGSGTWDSSTNTDWALTSAGTGGAAAPKAGTNVYFDENSDGGAPFTVTIGSGAVCKNMSAVGLTNTMTWSGSAAMSVYGDFTVPATNFTQSYTGTITFTAPSSTLGNQLITTNGKTFTAATFVGVSQDWTLQDAFNLSGTATLTSGEIVLQSYTLTCNTFDSNNSNTRAINFGTGKIVITSTSTATVWNTATITGFSTSGTQLVELTGGGATTKTVSTGALSEANSISFSFLNTAGTVRFTSGNGVRNVIIENNSITYEPVPLTVYGDFTINGSNPTVTAGASTMTFAATSGTKVITTNGVTLDIPITFNGAGGTWRLGSSLTVGTSTSRTISHLTGTVDLYGYDITLFGIYSITGTNTRALNNTGGTTNAIILSLNTATTVWSGATLSNFTTDGNINVKLTGSGATTKTVTHGTTGGNENNAISVEVTSTFAGTVSISIYVRNLTFANTSYTIANTTMTIYGNVTFAGNTPTLDAGTNVWTFAATSGTKTITSGGEVFDFPITFNGAGGTWQLQDALSIGTATSRTVTLTAGTIDLNEYNITLFGQFSSSNSNSRTLDFGGASKIILTASGTTVWSSATATNFEVLGTNPLVQATGNGATVTMSFGAHSESGSVNVQLSSTTTTTVVVTGSIRDLIIDNNDITLSNGTRTLYGNLTVSGTTPLLSSGTSVTTFAATSGIKTINLNGNNSNALDFPITFNGVGGTWQLQHVLGVGSATSRTVTLTNGTLDLNNYTFTIYGIFSSSNSNARTIAFGSSGKIVLSLSGATSTAIWACSTATNLTVTGTSLVEVIGFGTLVRTIQAGSTVNAGENGALSFNLLADAGTISLTGGGEFNNLTINSVGATVNFTSITIYGNLVTLTTPTFISSPVATFAGNSGVKTIDTGGVTYPFVTVYKGTGGELRLANNLTLSNQLSVNSGTFSANNYSVVLEGSTNPFISNTFSVRTINLGQNDWILSSTGADWVIENGDNLTFNKESANIIFTANSGTSRTMNFYGGNKTYNAVIFNGSEPTQSGTINVYGNNTFDAFLNFSPLGVTFQSNSYNYFNNVHFATFSTRPNIYSTTQTIRANLVYTGNTLVKKLRFNSFDVRDIAASPSDFWYFGPLSVDDGNNSNVYFTNPPLYWYNGSGVWSETSTSNWSFFTGGGVAGSAGYYPDANTEVFFDANSDVGTSYSVTTSNNINVGKFNVFDQQYPLDMQISSTTLMNVYGDYYTTNVNFTFSGNSTTSGTIQFPQSANIITNGTVAKCAFSFDGTVTFNFNDNFTTESNVSITRATAFNFNNNIIKTSDFGIKGISTKNIYFGDSGILQLQNYYGDAYIRMDVNQGTAATVFYGNKLVEIVGADNIYINTTEFTGTQGETNAFSYNVKAGNTIYLAGEAKDLNFSGFTGTWASNNFVISGNLILSNTMTIAGTGTHTLSFDGDLRGIPQYFTCNGQSLPYNIDLVAVNNFGYELLDTFRTSANTLFNLDSSTLNLSNYDLEINGTFYSVGSPVRGLLTNGGRIKITTNGLNAINGTTVFDTSTPTNLSNPNNVIVELYGNTSANVNVTRFASVGFMDEANTFNIIVNQAGGTFAFGTPNSVKSLTLKSNTSTYDFSSTSRQMTIYKDLTIESGITHTGGTGVLTFAGTGSNSQTITTNGFVIDKPVTLGGTARYILGDAFTLGSARTLTFNSGNLDVNGYTMTVNTMVLPGTSTRVIDHGSNGTITVTGSGMSFNANGRNISYEGLGRINMTAGASKIFTANGNSFATLNQGGTGKLTVSNGGIFYNMTSTVANTFVEFYYLDNYTFTNDFQISGANNSHRVTLISNTHPVKGSTPGGPNNARFYYTGNSVINVEYMLIRGDDFGVSPNNTWYVRRSPKTIIGGQDYNDESANSIIAFGYPVGDGWVFIRENNFFPFFI